MAEPKDFEILFARADRPMDKPRAKAYRTRVTRYGDMMDVECYPMWDNAMKGDLVKARKGLSTPAQEKLNVENRRKHVRHLVGANFGRGDCMVTLTYDYGDLDMMIAGMGTGVSDTYIPQCDDDAARDLRNFIRRCQRWVKRNGIGRELKWLSVTEVGKEQSCDANPLPRKYHHHVLISGIPADVAEGLWQYGRCNSKALQPNRQGLNEIAGYICKQRMFYRQFRHSKNLKQPTVMVSDRKISARRANRIAENVMIDGRAIFEKIYPDYELADKIDVRYSDYVAGAYIRTTMHRRVVMRYDAK